MDFIFTFMFWFSLLFILYTYAGYFIFLQLTSIFLTFARKNNRGTSEIEPSVSLIIAAYNEDKVIEEKILNSLQLNYPKNKLEIIVASDCSTDETDRIVNKYKNRGVILARLLKRGGKTAAQNESLNYATGDILVFSDANSMYEKNAIRHLIKPFKDKKVGCVGGRLTYKGQDQVELIKEKGLYLNYDQYIKLLESKIRSCIGLDGAIYAIRRSCARPIPDTITTDFAVPLDVIKQNYKVDFENRAVAYELIASSSSAEFKRKVRTVKVGANVIYSMRELLNIKKFGMISIFLYSHKIFRWILFIFLAFLFISNVFLIDANKFYFGILCLQILFYLFSIIGLIVKKRNPNKLFTVPFYFCMYNICAAVGLFKFLTEEKTEIWEVER